MARREKVIQITTAGRDKGKSFHLRELPADQGESWAIRTGLALTRGGVDLPPGIFSAGMAGLASVMPYLLVIGLKSFSQVQWAEIEPMLTEMMGCVRYMPPGGFPPQDLMPGEMSQIEEVGTRVLLRKEVLLLHLDPSVAGMLQTMGSTPDEALPAS